METIVQQQNNIGPNLDQQPRKKELLFSGGAGAIGYQMGYCQGLIEIVGKEKLKEYRVGGVSAGSAVAGYFLLAVYDEEHSMKDSYYKYARKMFEKNNKKYFGLFTSCDTVRDLAYMYWDLVVNNPNLPPLQDNFHLCMTHLQGIFSIKPLIANEFLSREDFGEAVSASCALPLVTTFGACRKFRGKKVVDGGFTRPIPFIDEDSEKVFLNVLPEFCNLIQKMPKNISILNITSKSDVLFPRDYWLWSEYWSDEMYLKGYLAALNDTDAIKKTFKINEQI
ncbi:hypothetical protein ABPG72_015685 [Tetrahymena utriculariae]